MYGKGLLKSLSVTWKRFWDTYIEDISWWLRGKKRYYTVEGVKHRSSADTRGIFTVQYPEEQLILPEEARYIPFLVYNVDSEGKREILCTSCGICAKVCPPQCIWIVRSNDPVTNRPIPEPSARSIVRSTPSRWITILRSLLMGAMCSIWKSCSSLLLITKAYAH